MAWIGRLSKHILDDLKNDFIVKENQKKKFQKYPFQIPEFKKFSRRTSKK